MKTKEIEKLILMEVNKASKITILTHKGPDGDAIGSVLGLCHFLKSVYNKELQIIIPDRFPDFLTWMPGAENIMVCNHNKEAANKKVMESDLIFCLDFNHASRVDAMELSLIDSEAVKVMIDHHPDPQDFCKYTISDTKVSSTAELIYNFITACNGQLTKDIATCLFTGIITDTGGFNHNSSHPDTYHIVAHLLETGVDKNLIFDHIYSNYSTDRMRLMGFCLNQKMKVFPEYRTAYISLSQEELKQFNFQTGDTEGFVNLPLSINNVIFSAFFIEKDGIVKTSFRSKRNFAVNNFSKLHFNGGGHRNAAGGSSKLSLKETIDKFEALLPDFLNELKEA